MSINMSISPKKMYIIGGGITGLALSVVTGFRVFEKENRPGGVCCSYHFDIKTRKVLHLEERDYRYALFEHGGGHWIWGLDRYRHAKKIFDYVNARLIRYVRKALVYLTEYDVFVPYPLQYNLALLPKDTRDIIYEELLLTKKEYQYDRQLEERADTTFDEYLKIKFGKTLYRIFFGPFNRMYTAGLIDRIAPPRSMKIASDTETMLKSFLRPLTKTGYNAIFYYPEYGLNTIVYALYRKARCKLNSRVTSISAKDKKIVVNHKTEYYYDIVFVTIPLNKLLNIIEDIEDVLANYSTKDIEDALPYTSVFVVNAIVRTTKNTPKCHWIYFSKTRSGAYRLGFYSNVSRLFLPQGYKPDEYASIYLEKAYKYGEKPRNPEVEAERMLNEMQSLEFIGDIVTFDCDYIEVAYTWRKPRSHIITEILELLKNSKIIPVGRYATWGSVEGISESIEHAITSWLSLKH